MAYKMHPTTIRLTDQDQTFLATLKISGASTISDKVRAMIDDRRLQQQAVQSYGSALTLANGLIGPLADSIKLAENEHHMHSQLVQRVFAWAPELLATLMTEGWSGSSNKLDKKQLQVLETAIVGQLLRLIDVTLQSCLARDTALYDGDALAPENLTPLLKLCRLIVAETNDSQ